MNPSSLFRGTVSPGSACLVAAVPEEWIDTIPAVDPATGVISSDIVLKTDRKWLRMVLVSKSRFFKEESDRSDAGLSWLQSILGRSCGYSAELHMALERWAFHRWVILYQEVGTGATYLVGKPGSGAIVNIQYSNERATVANVSFTRQGIQRAPIYTGSYTLDNDVVISNPIGPGMSSSTIDKVYYEHNGADTNSVTFSALVGKTIISVSRSGAKDLKQISNTDPLTKDNEFQHYPATGQIVVADDWKITQDETLLIIFK